MRRSVLLVLGVLVAGSCAHGQAPNGGGGGRWALLVACTDYPSLDKAVWLKGPTNDVALMRELLTENYRFPPASIVTLAEEGGPKLRPTAANIAREFQDLAGKARAGDQVVILLSGHGTQVPDVPPLDEADGYDEAYLPADIGPWVKNKEMVANAIVDDDLNRWLGKISGTGAHVWFIADSCHSGTLIRGLGDEVERKVPPEMLKVPAEVLKAIEDGARDNRNQKIGGEPAKPAPGFFGGNAERLPGLVALYAAQPDEPTVEAPLPDRASPYHGLLTYTMIQTLKEARTPLTYRQLARRIASKYVALGKLVPTPLLDGGDEVRDRYVLGREQAPNPARYQLTRDNRGRLSVDAGALHGLTVGTILAVMGEAGGEAGDKVLGHVVVAKGGLGPLDSQVEPCQPDGTLTRLDLPSPRPCRVASLDYGDMRVRVSVDTVVGSMVTPEQRKTARPLSRANRERLTAVLRGIAGRDAGGDQLISAVDDPAEAEWLLRATTPAADMVELVPAAGWARTKGDAPPHVLKPSPLEQGAVKEQFVRIARARNLLKVAANQPEVLRGAGEPPPSIDLKVEMLRLANKEDRQGEVVSLDPNLTLRAGDLVGFRVENRGRDAVDVTLLWIDGDFKITAVFPDGPGVDNRLLPASLNGKPLLRRFALSEEGLGREHLVVIGVEPQRGTERVDFGFLAERTFADVVKSIEVRGENNTLDSPLGKLLQSAVFARGLTRGPTSIDARSYSIQDVSWRSQLRAKDEPTR